MTVAGDWREFFLGVGQAAAVLTGLLFAALALHPTDLLRTPLFRQRALGALIGLVWVTFASLALLAPEWLTPWVGGLEVGAPLVLLVGNLRALIQGWRDPNFHRLRGVLGNVLLVVAAVGGALLAAGRTDAGFVVLGGALVGSALAMCWQGWSMMVTASQPEGEGSDEH